MSQSYKERTEGCITSSKLEDFVFCQYLFKLKWLDNVSAIGDEEAEEYEEEESDALVIGSAYDLYMQSVEKFNEEYAIVSKRDGKSGKIELTRMQGKLIRMMAKEMIRQPYYNSVGEKQSHVKIQYNETIAISGTLDEFQKDNLAIFDDKTSQSERRFDGFREKYRRQLEFYQYLIYIAHSVLCDGMIRMVTKEKKPKSYFYFSSAEDLRRGWTRIEENLEALTTSIKTNSFMPSPRDKCLRCPAYDICQHSVQKELYIL